MCGRGSRTRFDCEILGFIGPGKVLDGGMQLDHKRLALVSVGDADSFPKHMDINRCHNHKGIGVNLVGIRCVHQTENNGISYIARLCFG